MIVGWISSLSSSRRSHQYCPGGKTVPNLQALTALIFILLLLAACGVDPEVSEESLDDQAVADEEDVAEEAELPDDTADVAPEDLGELVVAIGAVENLHYLPFTYGPELGVWERRGLDVQPLYVEGGGQVGQTIAAGQADMGVSNAASLVTPIVAAGLNAKLVASPLVDFTTMVLVVSEDAAIEDWEDLEGEAVGITSPGSLTDWLVDQLAGRYGWQIDVDIHKAPVGGLSEQLAALQTGATAAFIWSPEAGFVLEEEGEGRVFADFSDIVDDNVAQGLLASDEVIQDRPEAVQAYIEGWFEVVQYMKDNRDETIEFTADVFGISRLAVERAYDLAIDDLSADGAVPPENLDGLAQSVVESGAVDEAPAVEAFFVDRFVPVALD